MILIELSNEAFLYDFDRESRLLIYCGSNTCFERHAAALRECIVSHPEIFDNANPYGNYLIYQYPMTEYYCCKFELSAFPRVRYPTKRKYTLELAVSKVGKSTETGGIIDHFETVGQIVDYLKDKEKIDDMKSTLDFIFTKI